MIRKYYNYMPAGMGRVKLGEGIMVSMPLNAKLKANVLTEPGQDGASTRISTISSLKYVPTLLLSTVTLGDPHAVILVLTNNEFEPI